MGRPTSASITTYQGVEGDEISPVTNFIEHLACCVEMAEDRIQMDEGVGNVRVGTEAILDDVRMKRTSR